MYEREIVLSLSLPSNEERAESVVPASGAFHYPSPRLASHTAQERLLALLSDVRCDPTRPDDLFAVTEVVALIETHMLGTTRAAWRSQHDCIEGCGEHPLVVHIGTAQGRCEGNTTSVSQDVTLKPAFRSALRPVRGVRACLIPPLAL